MVRVGNKVVFLLLFSTLCAIAIPAAAETGCEIYYDNCKYECDQLVKENADLDYNAQAVFDCHERICSNAFEDKFCGIAAYAPCMQKVMDAYFSCMRSCVAQYRQTTDTAARSDIRNFCPGDCICNFYRDLYLSCDKSVCDEYCTESGYLDSDFTKSKNVICTSGSRKEYQYNCECSGIPQTTKPAQPVQTTQTFIAAQPLAPAQPVQSPQQARTAQPAQTTQPPTQPQPQPTAPDYPDIGDLFWLFLDWLARLVGGSPFDVLRNLQPAPQQQPVIPQQPAATPTPVTTDLYPNLGDIGQPPNPDGTCDVGAVINGICRHCGRWGERACPLSYGYECEPLSENRNGRCVITNPRTNCGVVGTKPCDAQEGYDQPFCYEGGIFDPNSYSCVVCGDLADPCCLNTDYPCDRPYKCEAGICVRRTP